jgi:PAS domain S-box-containing protein
VLLDIIVVEKLMDFWIYLLILLFILLIALASTIKRRREFEVINKKLLLSNESLEKARRETDQQKNLFEALFNSAVDGLTIIENGQLVDCNDSLLKMYKIKSKEEFKKGKPGAFTPTYQPDGQLTKKVYKSMLDICLNTGCADYEMQVNDTFGEYFWVHVILKRINVNDSVLLYSVIRNITQKKQMELEIHQNSENILAVNKALEEQKNFFEALFNYTNDALIIIENGVLVDCNLANLKTYKFKNKADFRNGKMGDMTPESQPNGQLSQELFKEQMIKCNNQGLSSFEAVVKDKEGLHFWVFVTLIKVEVNDKDIVYCVIRDIDERKKMEAEIQKTAKDILLSNKALEEQKNFFEALFNHTNDALTIIEDGSLVDCNAANLALYKFDDKEDFRSGKPGRLTPQYQPDGQLSSEVFQSKVAECNTSGLSSFEIQVKDKLERPFWVFVTLIKVAVNDKDIIYSVIRDIDDHKKMEAKIRGDAQQLAIANEKLEATIESLSATQNQLIDAEKMASLGGLVAGVAHEINTPIGISLTAITHFKELSEEIHNHLHNNKLSKQALEKYFDQSKSVGNLVGINLSKAAELVSSFKQIAVDQSSEEKRDFNLRDYSFEVLASLHTVTKKIALDISIDCAEDINLQSYPGAYSQVLTNLIMNSIIHGFKEQSHGEISIKLTTQGDRIDMLYTDNGKGIAPAVLAKIFDPFFTTNRDNGGSGLGLNIIYNIVTSSFNGSIKCQSTQGEGTQFIIVMYM